MISIYFTERNDVSLAQVQLSKIDKIKNRKNFEAQHFCELQLSKSYIISSDFTMGNHVTFSQILRGFSPELQENCGGFLEVLSSCILVGSSVWGVGMCFFLV